MERTHEQAVARPINAKYIASLWNRASDANATFSAWTTSLAKRPNPSEYRMAAANEHDHAP